VRWVAVLVLVLLVLLLVVVVECSGLSSGWT
jgi:hypothetical protein